MATAANSPSGKRGGSKPVAKKPAAPRKRPPKKGVKQTRPPAHKMVVRDAKINALRAQGLPWEFIATETKTPESTCRAVWRRHVLDPERGVAIENAREIIQENSLQLETLSERMAALYWKLDGMKGDTTANIIGATKAQADMLEKRTKLLQSAAIIPNELGTIRHIEDTTEILATFIRILDEEGVPQRVFDRLMAELPLMPERSA